MVLQEKDNEILDFVEKFHCVSTSQIVKVFYGDKKQGRFLVNRKMGKLVRNGLIKRNRELFRDYVYYFKKSSHERHHLVVSDLYVKFLEWERESKGELVDFKVECDCEDIRPDVVVRYKVNGSNGCDEYLFCFEVHLSNNGIDIEKYEKFYYSGRYGDWFEWFPVVVIVSDKRVRYKGKLPVVVVDVGLRDFEKIFI